MSTNRTIPMLALIAVISLSRGMRRRRPWPPLQVRVRRVTLYRSSRRHVEHSPITMPINPVHAALLHTERSSSSQVPVTVLQRWPACPSGPQHPHGAALMDLSTNKITTISTSWDMFCNGMSIMQDGRVLINGGTKGHGSLEVGVAAEIPFTGLPNTSIFDPGTESMVDVTPTAHGRWYPTVTELNDGRMMTTSGLNDTDGNNNNTSEIWDGQKWSAEIAGNPHISDFPEFEFPIYPRMHLLPTGHVFYPRPRRQRLTSTQPTRLGRWWHGPPILDQMIRMVSGSTAHLYCCRSRHKITTAPR